jgi:hypothetical protein
LAQGIVSENALNPEGILRRAEATSDNLVFALDGADACLVLSLENSAGWSERSVVERTFRHPFREAVVGIFPVPVRLFVTGFA